LRKKEQENIKEEILRQNNSKLIQRGKKDNNKVIRVKNNKSKKR